MSYAIRMISAPREGDDDAAKEEDDVTRGYTRLDECRGYQMIEMC